MNDKQIVSQSPDADIDFIQLIMIGLLFIPIFLNLQDTLGFSILIHYLLYIFAISCAVLYFFTARRLIPVWLENLLPKILFINLFWDIFYPLYSIPTFSLLKLLFYLLALCQFPTHLFHKGRFFNVKDPIPPAILLVLIAIRYITSSLNVSYSAESEYLATPLLGTILRTDTLNILLFIIMLILTINLFYQQNKSVINEQTLVLGVSFAVFLSLILDTLFDNRSSVPIQYFTLFGFVYTSYNFSEEIDDLLQKLTNIIWLISVIILFVVSYYKSIILGIDVVLEFQNSHSIWWTISIGLLGIISSIYSIVDFHKAKPLL